MPEQECRFTGILALLDTLTVNGIVLVDHGGPIGDGLPVPLLAIREDGTREAVGRIETAERGATSDGEACINATGHIRASELPPGERAGVAPTFDGLEPGQAPRPLRLAGNWSLVYAAIGPDCRPAFPGAHIRRAP